jgi:hypothetical protein
MIRFLLINFPIDKKFPVVKVTSQNTRDIKNTLSLIKNIIQPLTRSKSTDLIYYARKKKKLRELFFDLWMAQILISKKKKKS